MTAPAPATTRCPCVAKGCRRKALSDYFHCAQHRADLIRAAFTPKEEAVRA